MSCVIQIIRLEGLNPYGWPVPTGYIKSFDVEAKDGHGHVVTTEKRDEALTFPSAREALIFLWQEPKCRPIRPDGKPNRPLTAFTVEIINL